MAWKFEVYADAGGKHRWRCEAENRENVAGSGEAFDLRSNAQRAAETVKANAAHAHWSYEVYADAGGSHRWRLLAANKRKRRDLGRGVRVGIERAARGRRLQGERRQRNRTLGRRRRPGPVRGGQPAYVRPFRRLPGPT